MGPLEMACFQVFEPARSEEVLWHAHDVYRVLEEWLDRKTRTEGRAGGGTWEQKHGKNNRKGTLRDQA